MDHHPDLHAVIGVWRRKRETYFIKRSSQMENYPDVWTLFSIQYDPHQLEDPSALDDAQRIMEEMAAERLNNVDVSVKRHIVTEESDQNPIDTHVHLDLYEITLAEQPELNPRYYVDAEWMTLSEYAERNTSETCGSCMRMYWDWAWTQNIAKEPFPADLK